MNLPKRKSFDAFIGSLASAELLTRGLEPVDLSFEMRAVLFDTWAQTHPLIVTQWMAVRLKIVIKPRARSILTILCAQCDFSHIQPLSVPFGLFLQRPLTFVSIL